VYDLTYQNDYDMNIRHFLAGLLFVFLLSCEVEGDKQGTGSDDTMIKTGTGSPTLIIPGDEPAQPDSAKKESDHEH
jgi:hypothetical protein